VTEWRQADDPATGLTEKLKQPQRGRVLYCRREGNRLSEQNRNANRH